MKHKKNYLLFAILWLIFTTILLCIPGKKIPSVGWLHLIPQLDKLVHILLFGVLCFLFCKSVSQKYFLLITVSISLYGLMMEFVQKNYIPNRSFDIWDVVADTAGSLAAIFFILKNKKQ